MAVSAIPGAPPSALERLIDDYLANCEARGLSQRTIRNSYSYALKQVLLPWCAAEGEIDLVERSVDSERDKLIVRIFGDCGLRLEGLTQLRPQDIVRSGRQAHMRVLGKGSRVRDVPIPPQLLRRLERFIESRPED